MKKSKGIIIAVALMIVGITGGVLGTLAYLKSVTQTATNTFSSDKNINIALREPAWDGYTFEDATTQNGAGIKPGLGDDATAALGFTKAHSYVPGQLIPKNPMVKNSNDEDAVSVYAAIKVQYFDKDNKELTYDEFKAAYLKSEGISFDTTKWTKLDDAGKANVYIYKTALAKDEATTALFSQIPLSENLGEDGILPGFNIKVTGYAIQAEGISTDSINTEMYKFINNIK